MREFRLQTERFEDLFGVPLASVLDAPSREAGIARLQAVVDGVDDGADGGDIVPSAIR